MFDNLKVGDKLDYYTGNKFICMATVTIVFNGECELSIPAVGGNPATTYAVKIEYLDRQGFRPYSALRFNTHRSYGPKGQLIVARPDGNGVRFFDHARRIAGRIHDCSLDRFHIMGRYDAGAYDALSLSEVVDFN